MSNHTPGPWYAFQDRVYGPLVGDRNMVLASAAFFYDGGEDNARVMAASPDMLAALKLVADSGKFQCFDDASWDAVNAAIAKAESTQ